jgi:hypothetical protein
MRGRTGVSARILSSSRARVQPTQKSNPLEDPSGFGIKSAKGFQPQEGGGRRKQSSGVL